MARVHGVDRFDEVGMTDLRQFPANQDCAWSFALDGAQATGAIGSLNDVVMCFEQHLAHHGTQPRVRVDNQDRRSIPTPTQGLGSQRPSLLFAATVMG